MCNYCSIYSYDVCNFSVALRKYLRSIYTYETPTGAPRPPDIDFNLETFTPMRPLSHIPELDNIYEEIPDVQGTSFQPRPSQSERRSRDGIQTEVKVLDTPDASDNDNESGSSSATSGDEVSSNTIPNQHLHQVPSEYLHPATYVNVQPKLYKPDEQ